MQLDFSKYSDGLMPAIVQDNDTRVVLMLGFMDKEAFRITQETGKVTFYSRSKKRHWTKGEESGHYLQVREMLADCDKDTILIKATPHGPVCHTGADTCWSEKNHSKDFLLYLEEIIVLRKKSNDADSYVHQLFQKGLNKIAQKVGEEAVELVIEAKDNDGERFVNEAADLLFHYLVLLNAKGYNLQAISDVLRSRHAK
jgi:phosphoribosyl-ATP pyrophosphohydrolase/phosphoribosyl-AMP cyclohydrolase